MAEGLNTTLQQATEVARRAVLEPRGLDNVLDALLQSVERAESAADALTAQLLHSFVIGEPGVALEEHPRLVTGETLASVKAIVSSTQMELARLATSVNQADLDSSQMDPDDEAVRAVWSFLAQP